MANEQMTYTDAYEKLQQIINQTENGDLPIDLLSDKIKEAMQLIDICTQKLSAIETDVNALIEDLEKRKGENYV